MTNRYPESGTRTETKKAGPQTREAAYGQIVTLPMATFASEPYGADCLRSPGRRKLNAISQILANTFQDLVFPIQGAHQPIRWHPISPQNLYRRSLRPIRVGRTRPSFHFRPAHCSLQIPATCREPSSLVVVSRNSPQDSA